MENGGIEGIDQKTISEISDDVIEKSRKEAINQIKLGHKLEKK